MYCSSKLRYNKMSFLAICSKKTVFSHQTIDLVYMSNQAVMADLVPKFESMRLTNSFSIDVIGMRQLSANSMQP